MKFLLPLLLFLIIVISSVFYFQKDENKEDIFAVNLANPSPIFSPEESLERMIVEDGFEVKLVAAEPLITTPGALTFDAMGRIWAVEMNGYMHDTLGTGEDIPNGKVVILEDGNKDGLMDNRKVFLDSLVMPRAICLIGKGILVAEPPKLWYYEINHDKPGKRVLVDGQYAEGGNVQHQSNGLHRALDNWIYNAKSTKRYRRIDGQWVIEQTHFRGQWGITQDNYGRLYYNTNSDNILGDFFSPGFGVTNKNQQSISGFNERIVADTRVYPSRPTPGVNRGYMEGILDDKQRLVNFTAAAGPLIYRGNLLGSDNEINAFVAEPAANLIKRNFLYDSSYITKGKQAYQGKEFIASVDERFRPVNLYNGPDGALYMVDMYRGILDHVTYMTSYLKNQMSQRQLKLPLNCGRIYKVLPENKDVHQVNLPHDDPGELVKLLGHGNGWVRDKAQQMLVDGEFTQAIPELKLALKQKENHLLTIHALWTIEGLNAVPADEVVRLLGESNWLIRMQGLSVLPSVLNKETVSRFAPKLKKMILEKDTLAAPYIAFIANCLRPFDSIVAKNLLLALVREYPDNKYVVDAVVSSLQDRETAFLKDITAFVSDTNLVIHKHLNLAVNNRKKAQARLDTAALRKEFPRGAALFVSSCQPCHGADGNGIKRLAPPLNQSEWITGNKNKLISIVLFGLTGPVKVNDHLYRAPEINSDMPGIGSDTNLSDEDVAQLLSFIRKSWRNDADKITSQEVAEIRRKLKDRQAAFTVRELNQLY